MAELYKEFELHPTPINECKRQLLERAAELFRTAAPAQPIDLVPLHAR